MTYDILAPFVATAGPHKTKILIVGEAFGEHEQSTRKPFVGESGKEFARMMGEAWPEAAPELLADAVAMTKYGPTAWVAKREIWLEQIKVSMTNVFALRPQANKIESLCAPVREVRLALPGYDLPHLSQGKYIKPEFLPELDRLDDEIEAFAPNLIIAAGNTACWALLRETNISAIRGTVRQSRPIRNRQYKVLPTYHPAGVMRQWAWRPIVVADLMKAWREAQSADISRPSRKILVNPTLDEATVWVNETLANPPALLSCDTETSRGQMTMVGFGRSRSDALLIPFITPALKSYWPEAWQEEAAWGLVARLLESPIPKVFQNGLYDFQYLLPMGIRLEACIEDTMLLHHSVMPEMKKGLGFLGSIYSNEPAWKLMRLEKADTEKRDE